MLKKFHKLFEAKMKAILLKDLEYLTTKKATSISSQSNGESSVNALNGQERKQQARLMKDFRLFNKKRKADLRMFVVRWLSFVWAGFLLILVGLAGEWVISSQQNQHAMLQPWTDPEIEWLNTLKEVLMLIQAIQYFGLTVQITFAFKFFQGNIVNFFTAPSYQFS